MSAPLWLLRNSEGRKDGAWTACVVALLAICPSVVLGGSELELGALTLRIPVPSTEIVGVIFATLGAYVVRRHKAKVAAP